MSDDSGGLVRLKPRRARPFHHGHPWIFSGAIEKEEGEIPDGSWVRVVDARGGIVGRGFFNSKSQIRVRLLARGEGDAGPDEILAERIGCAVKLRSEGLRLGAGEPLAAHRLIHSEGDRLSGLIVDRFAGVLVVQVLALWVHQRLDRVLAILEETVHPRVIVVRSDEKVAKWEGFRISARVARGELAGPVEIRDGGLAFFVDPMKGQKTGFYLDQRENRWAAARLAAGRRVLDAYCYSAAFGLHAAAAGAKEVVAVDSSESALSAARDTAARNGLAIATVRSDVPRFLQAAAGRGERFGLVVLDPPALAPTQASHEASLDAYRDLNRIAIQLVEREGFLVTCSCSQRVTEETFERVLAEAAAGAARELQVLEKRGQPPDHPVVAACPESRYLKCFVCRVVD